MFQVVVIVKIRRITVRMAFYGLKHAEYAD